MAEAVGFAASITSLITFAKDLAYVAKVLWDSAKGDCPKDVRRAMLEASSLQSTFESIKFICESSNDEEEKRQLAKRIQDPVNACGHDLIELLGLFPKEIQDQFQPNQTSKQSSEQGKHHRFPNLKLNGKVFQFAVKWCLWKKDSCNDIMTRLQRSKSSIHLGLHTVLQSQVKDLNEAVRGIKKDVGEVQSGINSVLVKMDEAKICKALVKENPWHNHKSASKLWTRGTCNWLSTTAEWKEWLAGTGKSRLLWLHGILGAGKTILASFMIEQVTEHVKSKKGSFYSFYYCHHSHNRDESVPFLGWILNQLCRRAKSVPEMLKRHYQEDPDREPSIKKLLDCIEAVLVSFKEGRLYVVVDAIDESREPRKDLLKAIAALGKQHRFDKLSIAVTSRIHSDIQQELKSVSVPLNIMPFVDHDIRNHVRKRLENDDVFKAWNAELKAEVAEKVASKAKGMFRYASCQLDILGQCGGIPAVKKAVACLPPTLDETYDRILATILEKDRQAVNEVFALLLFRGRWEVDGTFTAPRIVQAIVTANPAQNGFFTTETLLRACGPLISIDEYGTIDFAHYTVREYLESSHLREQKSNPLVKSFAMPLSQREELVTLLSLRVVSALSLLPSSELKTMSPDLGQVRKNALYFIFATYMQSPQTLCSSKEHRALTIALLGPFYPSFLGGKLGDGWWASDLIRHDEGDFAWQVWIIKPSKPSAAEEKAAQLMMILGTKFPNILLDEFLESLEPPLDKKTIFTYQLTATLPRRRGFAPQNIPRSEESPQFSGSVLDLFLEGLRRGYQTQSILCRLVTKFGNYYPHLAVDLVTQVTLHKHHPYLPDKEHCCGIKNALVHGAAVNDPNTQFTPLQIACAMLDVEAVKLLLDNGAEPNQIGNERGMKPKISMQAGFEEYSLFQMRPDIFPLTGQMSPLHIVETGFALRGKKERDDVSTSQAFEEIKKMLIAKGARNNEKDLPLVVNNTGTQSRRPLVGGKAVRSGTGPESKCAGGSISKPKVPSQSQMVPVTNKAEGASRKPQVQSPASLQAKPPPRSNKIVAKNVIARPQQASNNTTGSPTGAGVGSTRVVRNGASGQERSQPPRHSTM